MKYLPILKLVLGITVLAIGILHLMSNSTSYPELLSFGFIALALTFALEEYVKPGHNFWALVYVVLAIVLSIGTFL